MINVQRLFAEMEIKNITISDLARSSGISSRFNTTWHRLQQFNHIANPNLIFAGQVYGLNKKHVVILNGVK